MFLFVEKHSKEETSKSKKHKKNSILNVRNVIKTKINQTMDQILNKQTKPESEVE